MPVWKGAFDVGTEIKFFNDSLRGRDLLSLHDFTREEVKQILDLAGELKKMNKAGKLHHVLSGKTLGMIFQKSSTRTRVSFEVGMYQLGGYPLFLSSQDLQLGRGETIQDTGKVLSRYLDGIMIRTFAQDDLRELAESADIPVINGLTDLLHPCQVLADLLTVAEHKGKLAGLKMAYIGDGNNMAHSLMFGCAKTGIHLCTASPIDYLPDKKIVEAAKNDVWETGSNIEILLDPVEAVHDADIIVTDVWASMGQEEEQEERAGVFAPYQVNSELVKHAKEDFIFLHCLPAHRGEEVTAEVIDGPHSVVYDEAENRLHAQKAVMALLM